MTESVLREVLAERQRQDAKWGEQNHPDDTSVDDEPWADWAREDCDRAARDGKLTWRLILGEEVWEAFAETDPVKLRAELIQVAAVAVNWVEAIDRRLAKVGVEKRVYDAHGFDANGSPIGNES